MKNIRLRQSFALDTAGRITSVDEVARGLDCECTCPCCGEKVLARQGEVREWHFAHVSGSECEGAAEGALHLAAKQLLLESRGIMMPEFVIAKEAALADGRRAQAEIRQEGFWLDYVSAEAEVAYGDIRPDIILDLGDRQVFVEIAVTHYVDQPKQALIDKMTIPAIEIDLGSIYREKWDWELLKEAIIDGCSNKKWLHHLFQEKLAAQAYETALKNASALPDMKEIIKNHQIPPRIRFWVGGRMVDVIERPFGLAIWSPYDPILNERIKSLMRQVGGRWQPRFKNWLTPLEAKEYLFGELRKMSNRSPDIL